MTDKKDTNTFKYKDALKECLTDYLQARLTKAPNGNYICPFCESGTGVNGTSAFTIYEEQTTEAHYKCFACNESGDIFNLIGQLEGINDFTEQYNRACELYPQIAKGERVSQSQINTRKSNSKQEEKETTESKKELLDKLQKDLSEWQIYVNRTNYFQERGITQSTINKFFLGYDEKNNRIIIPYSKKGAYYIARNLDLNNNRYYKPNSKLLGKEPIFNAESITNDKPLFVVEGQFDAISLYEAFNSVSSVSLGGCNIKHLLEELRLKRFKNVVILSLDNDSVGKENSIKITKELEKEGFKVIEAVYSYEKYDAEKVKDANDLLLANKEQLTKDILSNIEYAKEIMKKEDKKEHIYSLNLKEYLNKGKYDEDLNYFKKYKSRKSGFSNLDKHFTMYNGLCVLGGGASLGKSTFAINWADNLARKGEKVLYFALEQLPNELVTKLITRHIYLNDSNTSITNTVVKNGGNAEVDNIISESIKAYESIAENIEFVRCDFSITAEDIKEVIEQYIKSTHKKPIVFIDYLQLISAPNGLKADARGSIDHVVKTLKTIQLENELFMLVISNFNREAYKETVSYASFKESGMIEYTADYICALQLAVIESEDFKKAKTQTEKTNITYEANIQQPKEVELVFLKNRNGKQSFKVFFKYFTAYDTFLEDNNSQYDTSTKKMRTDTRFHDM